MSLLQPKQTSQFPPGGYGFVDPKTGFKCVGYEGTPQMHAVKIMEHRRANPKFYPPGESHWFDKESIVQEIYKQKFQTHPHLFRGYGDAPINVPAPEKSFLSPTVKCGKCGANEFENIYCKTCAGRRVVAIKCKSCGNQQ